jgi:hypothetical protein
MKLALDSAFAPAGAPVSDALSFLTDRAFQNAVVPTPNSRRPIPASPSEIAPATPPHVCSSAELEFMQAIRAYKQASGRMFPTWSEVLEVLVALGYQKTA